MLTIAIAVIKTTVENPFGLQHQQVWECLEPWLSALPGCAGGSMGKTLSSWFSDAQLFTTQRHLECELLPISFTTQLILWCSKYCEMEEFLFLCFFT